MVRYGTMHLVIKIRNISYFFLGKVYLAMPCKVPTNSGKLESTVFTHSFELKVTENKKVLLYMCGEQIYTGNTFS